MTDKELLKAMQSDDTDQIMLAALQSKLDSELEKPDSELNVDKINQITATIDIITGSDRITVEKSQQGIWKLKQEIRQQRRHKMLRRSGWIAACVCVLVIGSNIWSYSAYGMNSFSAAYQIMNGGITIDFDKDDSELYNENPYKTEMQKICKEHNLNVLIPTYLPSGFTPMDSYGDFDEDENRKNIVFYFKRGNAKLNLNIIQFANEDSIIPRGLPSDSYNISPQKFGEITVHIQKEEKQYWAAFQVGLTQYILYTDELDYDECQRVLESMLEDNQ